MFRVTPSLKLKDGLHTQKLSFYCKSMHNKLPVYLQQLPLTPNDNIHNYNTYGKADIHMTKASHEFAKSYVTPSSPPRASYISADLSDLQGSHMGT